jgi:hypothetical protein
MRSELYNFNLIFVWIIGKYKFTIFKFILTLLFLLIVIIVKILVFCFS